MSLGVGWVNKYLFVIVISLIALLAFSPSVTTVAAKPPIAMNMDDPGGGGFACALHTWNDWVWLPFPHYEEQYRYELWSYYTGWTGVLC